MANESIVLYMCEGKVLMDFEVPFDKKRSWKELRGALYTQK